MFEIYSIVLAHKLYKHAFINTIFSKLCIAIFIRGCDACMGALRLYIAWLSEMYTEEHKKSSNPKFD